VNTFFLDRNLKKRKNKRGEKRERSRLGLYKGGIAKGKGGRTCNINGGEGALKRDVPRGSLFNKLNRKRVLTRSLHHLICHIKKGRKRGNLSRTLQQKKEEIRI